MNSELAQVPAESPESRLQNVVEKAESFQGLNPREARLLLEYARVVERRRVEDRRKIYRTAGLVGVLAVVVWIIPLTTALVYSGLRF